MPLGRRNHDFAALILSACQPLLLRLRQMWLLSALSVEPAAQVPEGCRVPLSDKFAAGLLLGT